MRTPLALALVWWFALGGLGLIFPYYSLYLRENAGLAGVEVGLVMGTLPLVGLIAQPLWGQVADRTGMRGRVVTLLAAGSCLGYANITRAEGFGGFLLATAALALFSTAIVPSCVAVTLALLPDGPGFGRARVMGTLGFGVSVGLFPFVLHAYQAAWDLRGAPGLIQATSGAERGLELIFVLASAFLALAAVASLTLPACGAMATRARPGQWRDLFRNRAFTGALVFAFLAYLTLQGPMVLFPILVRDQGGGVEAIGRMWILMLLLEVPLVYWFGASLAWLGARGVIAVGITAAALRWSVSGFADDLSWVYAAQILHGVTVWGIILGVPLYVNTVVPGELRSTAQGLLAMLGVSLGSMLSTFGAGWLTDLAGPRTPARIAGLASVALGLALYRILPEPVNTGGARR